VTIGLLAVVVLLGLALRLAVFAGYVGIDDVTYISDAYRLAEGRWDVSTYFGTARLGMTGTLAVLFYVFGPSLAAVVVQPLFWSLLAIPLAYVTGRVVFNDVRVALLAALFVAVYPLDVIYATQYFPDVGAATLMWAAFLCFYVAEQKQHGGWHLAAGIALGVAYLHKETALFVLLPLALFLLYQRRWRRGYVWLGAGFVAVLLAEMIAYAILFSDPLYRFRALVPIGTSTKPLSRASFDQIRPGGLLFSPVVALLTNQEYCFFYPVLAWAIVSLVRRKDGASAPLLLFLLTVGLYTLYGPTSIRVYRHLRPLERYTLPLTVPGMLILSRWMWFCLRPKWRWATCGVLIATWLGGTYVDNSWTFRSIGRALEEFQSQHPGKSLVLHPDAYMSLFVANGFRPPSGAAVFGWKVEGWYAAAGHARRIDPSIKVYAEQSELSDCYVALLLEGSTRAPPQWKEVALAARARRWFVGPLESWGGVWASVAGRLSPAMGFVIYYVPPAERATPGA
jgi:4-amino-4-deoxy-L-arabinose transferase-like glycosyltransferase